MSKRDDLVTRLKDIIDDEDSSESAREQALRSLLRYDNDWAVERLSEFVEMNRVWAINLQIKLLDDADNEISGMGIGLDD